MSKRILVWLFGSLIVLICLLLIAGLLLQQRFTELLTSAVKEQSQGMYRLELKKTTLNLLQGNMRAEEVTLLPDTIAYQRLKREEKPASLYAIRCPLIAVSGANWLGYLITKRVKVSKIQVSKPVISQLIMRDTVRKEQEKKKRIPKLLRKAKFGSIEVDQITYQTIHKQGSTKGSSVLKGLSVKITDLFLDSSALQTKDRVFYAKDVQLYGRLSYTTKNGLYQLKVAGLKASTKQRQLVIDSFAVVPCCPETEFSQKLTHQGDRYDMLYPKIQVSGINFGQLEHRGRLAVAKLAIRRAKVHIFVNKGMPVKTSIASNNFPAFAFKRLALPLTIDTLRLEDIDLRYKELNPKSQRAGEVHFANLTGQLLNVSNDSLQWKHNPWIRSDLRTKFLGRPELKLSLNIDMSSKEGAFNYRGSLAGAPAPFFNQLLEPLMLAKAEKGYVQTIRFAVQANRYGAQVHTEMLYKDLKVAVLDAKSGELEKKGVLSLFVNWIAVKSDNPSKPDEAPRVADLHYEHPQERTFFNLMWKAVYSGLKINLGLPAT